MEKNDNFLYFLTNKMTKGKVYPPFELFKNLSRAEIAKAWQSLNNQVKQNKIKNHNFGLYLHLPFCTSKCRFCYCFSEQEDDFSKINQYTDSLIDEINFFSGFLPDMKINTIYVGGGTPSYLKLEQIGKIFNNIFENFNIDLKNWQFNFEGSAHTLDEDKLKLLKKFNVNRLSLGVQSLTPKVLKNINRKEDLVKLKKIVQLAQKNGIKYMNLDYVAGLPGETMQSFLKSFIELIKLNPDIIHLYKFYPADNTIFYKKGLRYKPEQVSLRSKMIKLGEKLLKKHGYYQIRNEFEAWGREFEARNKQDAERKERPYSVLGLGNYAKSHIFNILHYHNGAKHYKNKKGYEYNGYFMDNEEEMRYFIMSTGRGGFSIPEFENIFQINPLEKFRREFRLLAENNNLDVKDDFIRIITPKSNQYHYLIKKYFYSHPVLDKLNDFYKNQYDENLNYKDILEKDFVKDF